MLIIRYPCAAVSMHLRGRLWALQESQTSTQDSGASTAESQRVLADLRASNPMLTKEQEQAAMERLLNQGTQSVRPYFYH